MPKSFYSNILDASLDLWALLFAKRVFASFNKLLFLIGARGLGILNYKSEYLCGERIFLRDFLANYDSDNYMVVDVGANVGQFASCVLACTEAIKIRSYEPNPNACRRLKKSGLFRTERHTLVEKGVSDCISDSVIYDYQPGLGSSHSSLYSEVITDIHNSQLVSPVKIKLTTLDYDLARVGKRIAVLKIDTEGHERSVLEGASTILATNPPFSVLVEFNEMSAVSRTHFREIVRLIGPSYTPYRLLPGGHLLPLANEVPLYTEIYAFQNLIFLRSSQS